MSKNYGRVNSIPELKRFTEKLIKDGSVVSYDCETGYDGEPKPKASLHPEESFIVGISFTNDSKWARYIPLRHEGASNLDSKSVAELLWPLFNTLPVIAHNHGFELRYFSLFFLEHLSDHPEYGEAVRASRGFYPIFSDTMVEGYVDGSERTFGLKAMTKNVLGHDQAEITSLFANMPKNKMNTLRFNILELTDEVIAYACEDAAWCLALHEIFYPKVKDKPIFKVDIQLIPILARMSLEGLLYDWEAMRSARTELADFIELLEVEMRQDVEAATGEPAIGLNFGSPKQIGDLLFTKLKLESIHKTEKGMPSTNEKSLTSLAQKHPLVQRILDWRNLNVLHTRYLVNFEKDYCYADDNRAHPNLAQTLVAGGRFACDAPNYQQTVKDYFKELRTGESFKCSFRNFIIAPPGMFILGFDYSQIELRMTAGISQESAMLEAFANGIDVHSATAGAMFSIDPATVTKEQRQRGKLLNFALLYGQGVNATAEVLGISKTEAQEMYDRYFAGFPTLKAWTAKAVDVGKAQGYVDNIFGRKIVIWDFESQDKWIYAKGERLCVNSQVQGSAGDYMRLAMIRVDKFLTENNLRDQVKLVMNIHDALEFYVDESIDPIWLAQQMQPVVSFPIPNFPLMEAEFHYGPSWGQLKDIDLGTANPVERIAPRSKEAIEMQQQARESFEHRTPMVVPEPPQSPTEPLPEATQEDTPEDSPTVTITLPELPFPEEFAAFKTLVSRLPKGPQILFIALPDQDPVSFPETYLLGPEKLSEITMIFGQAQITHSGAKVDSGLVLSGLDL